MLDGTIDLSGPIVAWQSRVTVNGRPVEHLEWDVNRVMCHVPGETDDSGRSADASIKPAPAGPVVSVIPTPWQPIDGWPPRQGDAVAVEVSQDGVTWYPVLSNGLVDKPTGTLSGDMTVDVVEKIDRFSRRLGIDPKQWTMPPVTPGDPFIECDLHHYWFLNRALEKAGFWTTMTETPNAVLRVSMQGSRFPEWGTIIAGDVKGSLNDSRAYCSWGMCAINFTASWLISAPLAGGADLRVMIPSGQIRNDIASPSGVVKLTLSGASGKVADISVNTATRNASVSDAAGSVASISGVTDILGIRRSGKTWTLYTENGTASGTGGASSALPINTVTVDAAAHAGCGAIQLGPSSGAFPSVVLAPTAALRAKGQQLWSGDNITELEASPTVDMTAATLMDAIGAATLSHWGFDETGKPFFSATLGRMNEPPVRTLTDDTDIIDDVAWSQDWQAATCQVHADFQVPQRRLSHYQGVVLWDSGGGNIGAGETVTDIIHPSDDEDWIGVDTAGHQLIGDTTHDRRWNGTIFVGAVDLPNTGSGPDDRVASASEYGGSIAQIDGQSYSITRTGKSTQQVTERTGTWSWLAKSMQGLSTPIVRGYGKTTWVDGSIETVDTGADSPVYVHDGGKWIGHHGDLIVTWLQQLLTVDRVTLSELEIRPDPRLQLGDHVSLNLSSAGVTVTGFITGKHLTFADGILTMRITVVVTAQSIDRVTWAAFEEYMRTVTYSQFEDRNVPYSTFEANPLGIMGGS